MTAMWKCGRHRWWGRRLLAFVIRIVLYNEIPNKWIHYSLKWLRFYSESIQTWGGCNYSPIPANLFFNFVGRLLTFVPNSYHIELPSFKPRRPCPIDVGIKVNLFCSNSIGQLLTTSRRQPRIFLQASALIWKPNLVYDVSLAMMRSASCTHPGPNGSNWIVGSHGHSLYRVKTSMIRCWRWIWGSRLCGPKGHQSSKTSQGLASQIGTLQVRQGVRRPHLILARRMSAIRRAIRTSPSSGRLILM